MATPNHSKSEKQSVKWPLLIYIYMRGDLTLTASTDRLYKECSKIADHTIREHKFRSSFVPSIYGYAGKCKKLKVSGREAIGRVAKGEDGSHLTI